MKPSYRNADSIIGCSVECAHRSFRAVVRRAGLTARGRFVDAGHGVGPLDMVPSYLRLLRFTLLACCLLPVTTALCTKVLLGEEAPAEMSGALLPLALKTLGLMLVVWFVLSRVRPAIEVMSRRQVTQFEQLPLRYVDLAIFASAGVGLFLELAVIRLQTCEYPLFSFYKNMGLLACFAGLGLGYALSRRDRIPLVMVIPLLGCQIGLLALLKWALPPQLLFSLRATPVVEQYNMGMAVASSLSQYVATYAFLGVVFVLTALTFIPLGQACGRLMERRTRLRAYGLNLLGSIAGVVAMLVISSRWAPPPLWFAIGFAVLVALQTATRRILLCGAGFSLATIVLLTWPLSFEAHRIYSPYQLVERTCDDHGLMKLKAAGLYFQRVHDLSPTNANRDTDPELRRVAAYYDLPYRIHEAPKRVAVVGAGTGNDVAAALRANVRHVDAVEIDPVITRLGERFHPERPYSDPRVRTVVDDARSFLRTTKEKYDLVVYGLLDSHTLLSSSSSVRLDSFVYTVEGLKEARAKLADDGVLCLSFCTLSEEIGRKIYLMMKAAFDGHAPIAIEGDYDGAEVFVQGHNGELTISDNLLREAGFHRISETYSNPAIRADMATDDWPFFYMPRRVYPVSYVGMMVLVVALVLLLNGSFLSQRPSYHHLTFFFLGAGFMLVETKGITELGLTFGNTWQVIGIVIIGILVMAFLANCLVSWLGLKDPRVPFLALLASLALGLIVAKSGGTSSSAGGRLLSVVILTCPVFFSGIVFSTMLSTSKGIAGIMALNLLGAMCGGVLEYNAMYFGYQFLYGLAMALYGLGFITFFLMPAVSRATDVNLSRSKASALAGAADV